MLKDYLFDLVCIDGIAGHETKVAEYMKKHFSKVTDDVHIDNMGNVTATINGTSSNGASSDKSIMIFAHMDEVGYMVRKVEDDGFIRFERVGGPAKNTILGSKVSLQGSNGTVYGCVGVKSYHFAEASERASLIEQKDLWIDIGANSKEQALELGIKVGTTITVKNDPVFMANDTVCSKALDDRVGCAVLLQLAEFFTQNPPLHTVHLVASVQEEFNIRGILPVLNRITPALAIGIDITPSCDTPDLNHYSDVQINNGVGITCLNYHGRGTLAGLITKPQVIDHLIDLAENNNIPYKREVAPGVLTETSYIQFENGGTLSGSLSIPCRYTHSTSEVASLRDLKACYDLLVQVVNSEYVPK